MVKMKKRMSRSRYGRWQANCIQVRIEQLEFCFYWFTLDKSVFKRRVYFSFDCVLFSVVLIRFDFPFCKRKQTKKGKVGACFFSFFLFLISYAMSFARSAADERCSVPQDGKLKETAKEGAK